MVETTTWGVWTASKIGLSILKILSRLGIEWAKEKLWNKINVEIEGKMNVIFATEWYYPSAWLKFKLRNYSDVNLSPKNIVAWVILSGATIDKISWSKLEDTFSGSGEIGGQNKIPNLPAAIDRDIQLFYPIPSHVDFGRNELSLVGAIEFDSLFGTFVKYFQTKSNLSKDEWKNALDKWQKDCIDNMTFDTILNK